MCISNVLATYWRPCTQRFRESPNTCIRARITEYYTYVGGFTQTLLKYVYYRVFKRVLMLYHSLIHQECISENTAVYLDVLQRIQWKLCNTPNTLSIHNWYIVFHYLGAAGGTGSRIRPGYVNTAWIRSKYTSDTCIMIVVLNTLMDTCKYTLNTLNTCIG